MANPDRRPNWICHRVHGNFVDNAKGNRVEGSKKASFRGYAQVGLDWNFNGEETVPGLVVELGPMIPVVSRDAGD